MGSRRSSKSENQDGFPMLTRGDQIGYQYEVLEKIGSGSFGRVYHAFDHKESRYVTLKILKNQLRVNKQGKSEIKILEYLNKRDQLDKKNIIRLHCTFKYRSNIYLCFEPLSINLYEHMKDRQFAPQPKSFYGKVALQLLVSLLFMKKQGVVHCDLKPENILLKKKGRTGIKIVDFGSACYLSELPVKFSYIQSLYYRAPEVALGYKYTAGIDMWSFGCIILELRFGIPPFRGHSDRDQVYSIFEYLGTPSIHMLKRCKRANQFFTQADYKLFPSEQDRIPGSKSLDELLKKEKEHKLYHHSPDYLDKENEEHFRDFYTNIFRLDPDERMTPEQAMKHPWIVSFVKAIKEKMNQ